MNQKQARIFLISAAFKGKIIYDSFTAPMPVGFQEGARKMFRETYNKALEHGIITSLE